MITDWTVAILLLLSIGPALLALLLLLIVKKAPQWLWLVVAFPFVLVGIATFLGTCGIVR